MHQSCFSSEEFPFLLLMPKLVQKGAYVISVAHWSRDTLPSAGSDLFLLYPLLKCPALSSLGSLTSPVSPVDFSGITALSLVPKGASVTFSGSDWNFYILSVLHGRLEDS